MERFPAEKIIKTGTRCDRISTTSIRLLMGHMNILGSKKEYGDLGLGGSLGAATINRSLKERVDRMTDSGYQWLWQTGKYYIDDVRKAVEGKGEGRIREKTL